jgi:MoxR-like ATPase
VLRASPPPEGVDRAASTRAARDLVGNVEKVIRGNRFAIEAAAVALFAGGHVLIEDVPGVGKTMLGRSLARSLNGTFKRIQATPDLLPADITGTAVFRQSTGNFEFVPGPLFAHVVMLDEINRATPRTQSALLEAMDEGAVTVDGVRHPLPEPLFVIATQNPVEHHGTFPLPEGELDRFAISTQLGYVDRPTEREVVRAQLEAHPIDELEPVITPEEVIGVRRAVRSTHLSESVLDYVLDLARATRAHRDLELGASPRAVISLVACAQARALIKARDYVVPDDVKALAVPALAHRLVSFAEAGVDSDRARKIMRGIVEGTEVPVTGPPG